MCYQVFENSLIDLQMIPSSKPFVLSWIRPYIVRSNTPKIIVSIKHVSCCYYWRLRPIQPRLIQEAAAVRHEARRVGGEYGGRFVWSVNRQDATAEVHNGFFLGQLPKETQQI